jgi:hypothetical protein
MQGVLSPPFLKGDLGGLLSNLSNMAWAASCQVIGFGEFLHAAQDDKKGILENSQNIYTSMMQILPSGDHRQILTG